MGSIMPDPTDFCAARRGASGAARFFRRYGASYNHSRRARERRRLKVIIRQPRRRELEVAGNRQVRDVLRELGLNPEAVVVVQGADLLTRDAYVREDDTIEVISAISGGG